MSVEVKGINLKKIIDFLGNFAPISLSESWDNTGLLVEPASSRSVDCILLTNDLTEDVVAEALDLRAGLIISYHPPIFKQLTRITTATWKERIIGACLENKIAVYSPHTSWDCVPGGVNDWLAGGFDNEFVTPIIKHKDASDTNAGAGRFCFLKKEIKISDAVDVVKKRTSVNIVQLALARGVSLDTKIKTVAICAGSGSSVLADSKAGLYVTGEMSHHSILEAVHNGSSIILCNHSNSERGYLKEFALILEKEFGSDVKVFVSQKDKDPLQSI